MTVNNDKNYFRGHPEYHMHLHPEYPAYETLTDSYANMLSHHPELHYVGAHFGSLEWSVAEVGKRLNTFPYMAVDMAERIGHIHYQTLRNREEVRNFFIKYQDRIIYGTDLIIDETIAADALQDKAGRLWLEDWKFLTTDEEMRSPYVDGAFKGLKLPAAVIDKVYRLNAEKWYRMPPR
jgi:predicted TIM-barrel fold metal-dependent hydrolase